MAPLNKKSCRAGPVIPNDRSVKGTVPVFVIVIIALLVRNPSITGPKVTVVGLAPTDASACACEICRKSASTTATAASPRQKAHTYSREIRVKIANGILPIDIEAPGLLRAI